MISENLKIMMSPDENRFSQKTRTSKNNLFSQI
jgi:hypothetical protein